MGQIDDYTEKTTAISTDEYILQETSGGLTKKITHANFLKDVTDDISDLQSNPALPVNYISGLDLSNNSTDPQHDIDIATGSARNGSNDGDLVLSSGLTKRLDAAWVAGTNQGALDTGSVAADTWYYFWLIEKDSDSSIDVLISASATSPTMPSGYTKKRRIRGAVLTDGSSDIELFEQFNDRFIFDVSKQDIYTINPGTSRVSATMSAPPNMVGIFFGIHYCDAASISAILMTELSQTDTAPAGNLWESYQNTNSRVVSLHHELKTNSSSQIGYRVSYSNPGTAVTLNTRGFIDKGL